MTVEDTQTGQRFVDEADVVVSARGALNNISWPKIPGILDAKIPVMHSAAWDQEYVSSIPIILPGADGCSYDFEDKRVGIIGGGSSAIQIVPELQKVKGTTLSCFVRGKTWISTSFGDHAMELLGIDSIYCTLSS